MVDLILNYFMRGDEITKGVGPNQLIRYWPAAMPEWATKAIRDAFYASPVLPRLLKGDVVKRTIADGVSQRLFGYARRTEPGGQLRLERFGDSMGEMEVEIADDVYLLKAADAQKLLEPPRVVRLTVRPGSIQVKPGDVATFSVDALDQYGQPIPVPDVDWTASGGTIDGSGRFVAGVDKGFFTVHALAGVLDATTDVRVADDGPTPPSPATPNVLRWVGIVPPQKWMNFYTKVVSRFAATPGLKLTVGLEVPLPAEQAKSKTDETRIALRELGVSDDIG
jgi:hypothetical protein